MSKKLTPVCPACGSDSIGADAPCMWDSAAGGWYKCDSVYHKSAYCGECGFEGFEPDWKEEKSDE